MYGGGAFCTTDRLAPSPLQNAQSHKRMVLSCYSDSTQMPYCKQQASSGEHLNQKHRDQRRFPGLAGWQEEEEGLCVSSGR